jgi:acyl-CoA reductase-like NAD-dependent aldehyde dehydrogenase
MDLSQRLERLGSLAGVIRARREELITGIVQTSKKTRGVAVGEVDLALARMHAFDEVAARLDGRAPVGTVAVVFPGNASISNPVATIGTAFLAGNEVVGRFPGASRAWADQLEPLFLEHLPGVRFDHGPGPAFLESALADPAVAVVMIFGDDSWAAGYEDRVRESRTKFILEGPGKDPFLVLPGADLEKAARDAVRGGYYNAGQACTSPERFYVHASLVEEFVERVVELTRAEVVGEPEREDVTIGPIVSRRIAARITGQLEDAEARGARTLIGGHVKEGRLADGTPVAYVEPTVLAGVNSLMAITQDETFGPVIPIQKVRSTEEALRLAADHRYGLAASLYGGTDADAAALAETHGQVFRNEIWIDYFRRNLHAPYGGRKRSGWVWAWENGRFIRREGVRTNALEFSRAAV